MPSQLFDSFFADTRTVKLEADDIITSEGQPARPPVGEKQPARSLVGAETMGPKMKPGMKPRLFSRITQNHAAIVSLQYIYYEIIGLSYS